eukprot:jgi/Psemu1/258091/estExt_Genewise1Plus.C_2600047
MTADTASSSSTNEYNEDINDKNDKNDSLTSFSRRGVQDQHANTVDGSDNDDGTILVSAKGNHSQDDHIVAIASSSRSVSCCSAVLQRLRANWKVLLLGQVVSLALASAGAAQATLHFSCGLSVPTLAMGLVYLGVFAIHMPILVSRRWHQWQCKILLRKHRRQRLPTQEDDCGDAADNGTDIENDEEATARPEATNNNSSNSNKLLLHASPLWYLLLAFVDVEANTIMILGFRYTTLTSVTLFDALAIPSAMFLSRCIFFRSTRRYKPLHYFGVVVCMIGVVLNVLQDYETDSASSISTAYPHKLRGDLCAITGGIMFGLNDVLTELTLSENGDTTEYMGMLGFYGVLISTVQTYFLERDAIRDFFPGNSKENGDDFGEIESPMEETCSPRNALFLLLAFVVVINFSYAGRSRFLVISEATFFNLSLLTGDLWSVAFSVVAERIVPRPLFFVALTAVLSGVIFYEMAPSPAVEKQQGRALKSKNSDYGDDDDGDDDGIVRNFNDDEVPEKYDDSEIELNDVVIT